MAVLLVLVLVLGMRARSTAVTVMPASVFGPARRRARSRRRGLGGALERWALTRQPWLLQAHGAHGRGPKFGYGISHARQAAAAAALVG